MSCASLRPPPPRAPGFETRLRPGAVCELLRDGGWWEVDVTRRVDAPGAHHGHFDVASPFYDECRQVAAGAAVLRPRFVLVDGRDWLALPPLGFKCPLGTVEHVVAEAPPEPLAGGAAEAHAGAGGAAATPPKTRGQVRAGASPGPGASSSKGQSAAQGQCERDARCTRGFKHGGKGGHCRLDGPAAGVDAAGADEISEWRFEGHRWLGRRVRRFFDGTAADGRITGWVGGGHFTMRTAAVGSQTRRLGEVVPPSTDGRRALFGEQVDASGDDIALWHMAHDDGDAEDLDEAEMEAALLAFRSGKKFVGLKKRKQADSEAQPKRSPAGKKPKEEQEGVDQDMMHVTWAGAP